LVAIEYEMGNDLAGVETHLTTLCLIVLRWLYEVHG